MIQTAISFYFHTTFLFCLELFIGTMPFLVGQNRRKQFGIVYPLSLLLFLAATVLLAISFFPFSGKASPIWGTVSGCVFFLILVFLFACHIRFPFDVSFDKAFFLAVGGYSIEHISEMLFRILSLIVDKLNAQHFWFAFVFRVIVGSAVASAFYFCLIRKAINDNNLPYRNRRIRNISIVNLSVCIILSILAGNQSGSVGKSGAIVYCLYAIVSCTLCLLLQAGFFREEKLSAEKEQLQKVLDISREQQRISKETIDLINIKCHDIKYRIRMLDNQKDSDSIQKMTDLITIYDSICKTGNETLDLVLMEKKLLCEGKNIEFKICADGKQLDFMDDNDIYALFGNMLDNAVESSSKNPDTENRFIHLDLFTRGDMLFISEENDCMVKPVMQDGLPQTTKDDLNTHGYGVRSMEYLVKQYSGDILFEHDDGRFRVEIIIPIPDKKIQPIN